MVTATPQRKRSRSDQLFHAVSSLDTPIQGKFLGNDIVNSDDNKNNISISCPPSSEVNSTAMVSPFFDQKNHEGVMRSSSSSPMNTKLETLIEGAPSEELPDNSCIEQHRQHQHPHQLQQIPLSQTSLVSAAYSVDISAAFIHSDSKIRNNNVGGSNLDSTQPPMKRVKMQHHGESSQAMQEDVIPQIKSHVSKSQRHPQPTKCSLMEKLMEGGNNAMVTATKRNDTSCSSAVYCHVCGGQGDGATKQCGLKNDCSSYNSNNSRGNRSIASYFKVTKKQPSTSSSKMPSQSSQQNSKKPSTQHMAATSTNNNDISHLPSCRYCDRPTCSNPSCTKQCEECQQNFCSFCCKVNYDGMYEKTVCFECDELLTLSQCCDRMDLS